MKIKIGNLLNASEDMIIHGCNDQGVMGSGVARAIRNKWPECYKTYHDYFRQNGLTLGEIVWYFSDSNKIIGNAITQHNYGRDGNRYVDYDAIGVCFEHIYQMANEYNIKSIAIPAIGAGLGGGDWNKIKDIILSKMSDISVSVYILEDEIEKYS